MVKVIGYTLFWVGIVTSIASLFTGQADSTAGCGLVALAGAMMTRDAI